MGNIKILLKVVFSKNYLYFEGKINKNKYF